MAGYRFAICNELFQQVSLERAIARIRALGYEGVELAPFTLGEDPAGISATERREMRRIIEDAGLALVGLHWLLIKPAGLHMTTPDTSVRRRTWDYVYRLIDLCADLGGGVMVFGSPQQRSAGAGMSPKDAAGVFAEELARAAPRAESAGVRLLLEALPKNQTNVINSLAEAVEIVRGIGHPMVQTMFDVHNAIDETEDHSELIRKYFPFIAHVHVNELDGREPGAGNYDFAKLLGTLAELRYTGWISVEVFDFSRGAEEIAGRARATLQAATPVPLQTI
jgi:D-psicose/D-tagatose/L-ribulose 3-epimerase